MTSGEILRDLFDRYPHLRPCESEIRTALALFVACFRRGGKVLSCGNGGSGADADHLVAELMKGFLSPRTLPAETRLLLEKSGGADGVFLASVLQGALPAISLGVHGALISAFANDRAAEAVFAQQVFGYGRSGDVLVCFSTSGDSRNIVLAARTARAFDMGVIGLTGRTGGLLAPLCDAAIRVPEDGTPLIQELHLPVYHALAAAAEAEFFTAVNAIGRLSSR